MAKPEVTNPLGLTEVEVKPSDALPVVQAAAVDLAHATDLSAAKSVEDHNGTIIVRW